MEQDDPVARMCEEIGADSLAFVSSEAMVAASGQPKSELCSACFDGVYPLGLPNDNPNSALVRSMQVEQGMSPSVCGSADELDQFVQ